MACELKLATNGDYQMRLLNRMRQDKILFDGTIYLCLTEFGEAIGEKVVRKIPIHTCILAASGHYFYNHYTSLTNSLYSCEKVLSFNLQKVCWSHTDFEAVIDFIYNGKITLSMKNIANVAYLASYLGILALIDICDNYVKVYMDEKTYMQIFIALCSCEELLEINKKMKAHRDRLFDFIQVNFFTNLINHEKISQLSSKEVLLLLDSGCANDLKNYEVEKAVRFAVNWIQSHVDEQSFEVSELMLHLALNKHKNHLSEAQRLSIKPLLKKLSQLELLSNEDNTCNQMHLQFRDVVLRHLQSVEGHDAVLPRDTSQDTVGQIGTHTSVTENVPQHPVVKIEIDISEKVKTSQDSEVKIQTHISELIETLDTEKHKDASDVSDYVVVKVERDYSYTFENDSSVEKRVEVDNGVDLHGESDTAIDCGIKYIYDTHRTFYGDDHNDGQEQLEPLSAKYDNEWDSQLESYLAGKTIASSSTHIEQCDIKACSDIKERIEGTEGKYCDTGCEHLIRKGEHSKSTLIEQFDNRSSTDMNQVIEGTGDLEFGGLDDKLESYLSRKKLSSKCVSIEQCVKRKCTTINQPTDDTKGKYSDVIMKEPRTTELIILDSDTNDSTSNDYKIIPALKETKQEKIRDQLVDTQTGQHCSPGRSGEYIEKSVTKEGECTDFNRYLLSNKRKISQGKTILKSSPQSQLKKAKVKGKLLLQKPPLDFTDDNRTDDFTRGRPTGDAIVSLVNLDTDESKIEETS